MTISKYRPAAKARLEATVKRKLHCSRCLIKKISKQQLIVTLLSGIIWSSMLVSRRSGKRHSGIYKVWERIMPGECRNLIESMPCRSNAVLQAESGQYTKLSNHIAASVDCELKEKLKAPIAIAFVFFLKLLN